MKVDDDTFLHPEQLMEQVVHVFNIETPNYIGHCYDGYWCQGGAGYLLNLPGKRSIQSIGVCYCI